MQILVVEDDTRISEFLVKGLEENGYAITLCRSAEELLEHYTLLQVDLMIIDIMLPKMDGFHLVQTLRFKKNFTPILMLSALNSVQDKVAALDFGADDYLTKPFHFDELLSRVKALTRRQRFKNEDQQDQMLHFGSLKINLEQYKVFRDEKEIELSPLEFKLLRYLVENAGKPVSRVQILNAVWGLNFSSHTNVVDVYIYYLRTKLETENEKLIKTIKGVGYLLLNDDL